VRERLEHFSLTKREVNRIRATNPREYKNSGICLVAVQVGIRCKHCKQKRSFPGNLGVHNCCTALVGKCLMKDCKEIGDGGRLVRD
jgi:hypothetical protein